jgi:hypothetical protein
MLSLQSLQIFFQLKYNIQDGNKFKGIDLKGVLVSFSKSGEWIITAVIQFIFVALDWYYKISKLFFGNGKVKLSL